MMANRAATLGFVVSVDLDAGDPASDRSRRDASSLVEELEGAPVRDATMREVPKPRGLLVEELEACEPVTAPEWLECMSRDGVPERRGDGSKRPLGTMRGYRSRAGALVEEIEARDSVTAPANARDDARDRSGRGRASSSSKRAGNGSSERSGRDDG